MTLALGVLAATGSVCTGDTQDSTSSARSPVFLDESVVVLPAAEQIKREKAYDGLIGYQFREQFPPRNALSWLEAKLAKAGWQQLNEDIFNPDGGTVLRDWGVVEARGENSYTWLGYWSDRAGNVVRVSILYEVKLVGTKRELVAGDRGDVEVIAFSQPVADALRRARRPR